MITKLFKFIIIVLTTIFGFASIGSVVYADGACGPDVPAEVRSAAGCDGSDDDLPIVITSILNGIIAACGIVAVVFVVIGGINYITSNGDPGKIEKARKTIIYACIGLVIAGLSFAIVNFVIYNIYGGNA